MEDVRIQPNVTRQGKIEFLRALSVLSVPATYGESFGLYILEAWAAGVPVVQAGAVRWAGWAFCALPDSACLRCLFEDIPRDGIETCAEAGVVGPVVGVLGGLEAALVFRLLQGERPGGER